MDTLLLDVDTWDLCLDAAGNIAKAQAPYAVAQDVASACREFLGDNWYDQTAGIPYLQQILGHTPPLTVFQEYLVRAAKTVPTVVKAVCVITSYDASTRLVRGAIEFVTSDGKTGSIPL